MSADSITEWSTKHWETLLTTQAALKLRVLVMHIDWLIKTPSNSLLNYYSIPWL